MLVSLSQFRGVASCVGYFFVTLFNTQRDNAFKSFIFALSLLRSIISRPGKSVKFLLITLESESFQEMLLVYKIMYLKMWTMSLMKAATELPDLVSKNINIVKWHLSISTVPLTLWHLVLKVDVFCDFSPFIHCTYILNYYNFISETYHQEVLLPIWLCIGSLWCWKFIVLSINREACSDMLRHNSTVSKTGGDEIW